jgi:hypothetical protein
MNRRAAGGYSAEGSRAEVNVEHRNTSRIWAASATALHASQNRETRKRPCFSSGRPINLMK